MPYVRKRISLQQAPGEAEILFGGMPEVCASEKGRKMAGQAPRRDPGVCEDYQRTYDKRLKAMREQIPPPEKKKAVHGLKHGANISLSELARLAREEGMSYGYYVAKHGY